MAILGYREIIPRTFSHRVGDSPSATRVVAVTVDAPTASTEIIDTINIRHGDQHPDHTGLTCQEYSVDETDRHHVTVTYTYGVSDKKDGEDPDNPPWLQPDTWSFSTGNVSVPCWTYFKKQGIITNAVHSLVNPAGDTIYGITKTEAELKITITGSRLTLNLAAYQGYVNCINAEPWAGFGKHTVQCTGFSATPQRLEYQGDVIDYWQISFELVYRSGNYNIMLPMVGWHVIVDGKKQRAWSYIRDDDTGELVKVASPHPVSLNMFGGFLCGPDQTGSPDPGYTGEWSN